MRRARFVTIASFCLALASGATARSATLGADLSPIAFLVGTWGSGSGTVADTGGTSSGSSIVTVEANGSVLLRRDHTNLFGAGGKPAGSFDQIMMIYGEGGTLRADYSDGEHVIHYTSAVVVPGRSVSFATTPSPSVPSFRLTYEAMDPDTLSVRFEIAAPGQTSFRPIATGTLRRSAS